MSWLKSLRLARSNLPLTRRSSAFFCCRLMVPDSDRSVARPTRRALSTFTTLRSMVTTMGAALCSASALSLPARSAPGPASKEGIGRHKSELQSPCNLVCRLLLEKKKKKTKIKHKLKQVSDKNKHVINVHVVS